MIAFSLFAVLPLAGPDYFFDAHDAPHTVFYLTEFDAALRDGVWYPGWATDQALGYGYPTFVLYPPWPTMSPKASTFWARARWLAIKWTWALATVGAGLAMYAYARHVMGRQRGLLAAIVYVYVPYHLADIYVRAALAEYSAFVWMPLALLAFHRLVEEVTRPARGPGRAGLRRPVDDPQRHRPGLYAPAGRLCPLSPAGRTRDRQEPSWRRSRGSPGRRPAGPGHRGRPAAAQPL